MAIKVPDAGKDLSAHVIAWDLARWLRLLGERVRVDSHTEWGVPARWADEVSISVGGTPYLKPFANQINMFWHQGNQIDGISQLDGFDVVLTSSAAAEAATAALPLMRLTSASDDVQEVASEIRVLALELARLANPDEPAQS
jgi:hypothetical protein